MRPTVPLFLACATLCLAIPFPNIAPAIRFIESRISNDGEEALSLSVSARQSGLNFSPCASNPTVCVGDRTCITVAESGEQQTCSQTCVCLPPNLLSLFCASDSDCDPGESCVLPRGLPRPACIADEIVPLVSNPSGGDDATSPPTTTSVADTATTPQVVTSAPITTAALPPTTTTATTESSTSSAIPVSEGSDENNSDSGPGDQPQEDSAPSGLTLDPCQSSDDCQGSRLCLSFGDGGSCSGDDCRCFPRSIITCDDDSDCDEGEGCFTIADTVDIPFLEEALKQLKACGSRAAVENAPCIAVHSLGHISREELVFENDPVSHVLCDLNESCATPGHIVQYKGEGMMMKSYCELNGCVRKVMHVNSPKYRRGKTVSSRTDELVFTALAARFESRVEERALSAAVRLGF